tara:strand:+ start:182 stop:394 length:213 start_codon:yes stop_codon:yes gene_type:complete
LKLKNDLINCFTAEGKNKKVRVSIKLIMPIIKRRILHRDSFHAGTLLAQKINKIGIGMRHRPTKDKVLSF